MSIDLSSHQPPVSHHAADGFDRYAQREGDMRPEVVPRDVESDRLRKEKQTEED